MCVCGCCVCGRRRRQRRSEEGCEAGACRRVVFVSVVPLSPPSLSLSLSLAPLSRPFRHEAKNTMPRTSLQMQREQYRGAIHRIVVIRENVATEYTVPTTAIVQLASQANVLFRTYGIPCRFPSANMSGPTPKKIGEPIHASPTCSYLQTPCSRRGSCFLPFAGF